MFFKTLRSYFILGVPVEFLYYIGAKTATVQERGASQHYEKGRSRKILREEL